jgi:hypothetical protein
MTNVPFMTTMTMERLNTATQAYLDSARQLGEFVAQHQNDASREYVEQFNRLRIEHRRRFEEYDRMLEDLAFSRPHRIAE